jgi:hypothetical protein
MDGACNIMVYFSLANQFTSIFVLTDDETLHCLPQKTRFSLKNCAKNDLQQSSFKIFQGLQKGCGETLKRIAFPQFFF